MRGECDGTSMERSARLTSLAELGSTGIPTIRPTRLPTTPGPAPPCPPCRWPWPGPTCPASRSTMSSPIAGRGLVRTTTTAPIYRLLALATEPPKPGLVRVADPADGGAIEVEVWEVPPAGFASFVAALPRPMAIGKVTLADGISVPGFLCEPEATVGAADITAAGGWRAHLSSG